MDDSVDLPSQQGTDEVVALDRWRQELDRCFGGEKAQTVQGRSLEPFIRRFHLTREPFDDLIDGVAMDLGVWQYETFNDLYEYCRRVASAVGLICIKIFGYRDAGAHDYANALGVALQLTNIIRDVPTDLASGRVYLPSEDLQHFGCTRADLTEGLSEPVRALLKFECDRARGYYREAKAALPIQDARHLVAAEIMGAIYRAILTRIEQRDYDVFSEVVRIPRPTRAVIAGSRALASPEHGAVGIVFHQKGIIPTAVG